MENDMALEDYVKAYKLGKRDYQYRMLHGMQPTVQVLEVAPLPVILCPF